MSVKMIELVDQYIQSKRNAWSARTIQSERPRLYGVAPYLDGNPDTLWNELVTRSLHPNTRRTVFVRVTKFWQWCVDRGLVNLGNPYRVYMEENALQFKNVYRPKVPRATFEETRQRLASIPAEDIRTRALELLTGGLRVSEEVNETDPGRFEVLGKGNKWREVFLDTTTGKPPTYARMRRALAAVGLKPHDLRKILLNSLAQNGASEFELMKLAGWSSIQPARSYIDPTKESLKTKLKQVQGGTRVREEKDIP